MKGICFKKQCVWRTQIDKFTYYCPFGKCPFQGEINNDRERVGQTSSHKKENQKVRTEN